MTYVIKPLYWIIPHKPIQINPSLFLDRVLGRPPAGDRIIPAIPVVTESRRAFLRELNQILPEALDEMTRGSGDDRSPVAPVDLSQAIIGPGMAVFSKYAAVLEADGTPMNLNAECVMMIASQTAVAARDRKR